MTGVSSLQVHFNVESIMFDPVFGPLSTKSHMGDMYFTIYVIIVPKMYSFGSISTKY